MVCTPAWTGRERTCISFNRMVECRHGQPEQRPRRRLPSLPPRDPRPPRPGPRARDRDRRALRHVAQRRVQAPQGAGVGGPHPPRGRGARAFHRARGVAAAGGVRMGPRVRALLDRASRPRREILQGKEESEMTAPKTMELKITRTIAASPKEVYDAWLDPKSP